MIAVEEIDASDNVIATGFIDFHSHDDFVHPVSRHIEILSPLLLQGVTTLITGNCGFSPAPLTHKYRQLLFNNPSLFRRMDSNEIGIASMSISANSRERVWESTLPST
jgi:N-acyl-D-aspartate/D-glutamate deacylase